MTYDYFIFPGTVEENPHCELRLDDTGLVLVAIPGIHENGTPGQVFKVPDDTPDGHGAGLTITSETHDYNYQHGTLWLTRPYCQFDCDIFKGIPKPEPCPPTVILPRIVAQGQFLAVEVP